MEHWQLAGSPRSQDGSVATVHAKNRTELDTATVRIDPVRLKAVRETGLLDSEVEEVFDRLTKLAVRLLGIPAAFISLVDEDRDFYKSACGFGEPLASARELTGLTFCHYAILSSEPLIIPDTAADPRYSHVPTVQTLGVAAYVGIPLLTSDGQALGSFCAIDMQPHQWTENEIEVLKELAASANREIDLRKAAQIADAFALQLQEQASELEQQIEELRSVSESLEQTNEELSTTSALLEVRTSEAELACVVAEAAQQEAQSANAAKSAFLATMSHELRTPLNAIGGYVQLLDMGLQGSVTDGQRDFLRRIQNSNRLLLSVINDILNFAKLESGQIEFQLVECSVDAVLSEMIQLIEPQLQAKGLSYHYISGDPECAAIADIERLQQIVLNLLTNAVKFTASGGSVTLTAEIVDETIHVYVIDSGRGIPEEKLGSIFEPFVQVDRLPGATQQGVGLGLAISHDLACGMHGDLRVESTVGVGTKFTLVLPRHIPVIT